MASDFIIALILFSISLIDFTFDFEIKAATKKTSQSKDLAARAKCGFARNDRDHDYG